jgi:predicted Zn-dependent protease
MTAKLKYISFIILFILFSLTSVFAFTVEDEIDVGQEVSRQVEKKYKVLNDPGYRYRVNWVASLLCKVCPRKDLPYTFKIIDVDIFNAFSLPGGFIYICRGLMDRCNDGELAFILGHEMAHCAHSHQFHQAEKQNNTQLGLLIIGLLIPGGNLGNIAMNALGLAGMILNNSYSRDDERQADLDSISYMAAAGIDPRYAISAFEKMKDEGGELPGILNGIIGTHPLTDDRFAYIMKAINEINFIPPQDSSFPPYINDSLTEEQQNSKYNEIREKFKDN